MIFSTQILQTEICQRIHLNALRSALRGIQPVEVPPGFEVNTLRQRVKRYGPNVLLRHPDDIQEIFEGVTLSDYQSIQDLYCSRFERSISIVWQVVNNERAHRNQSKLSYEAVWAICLYLQERRDATCNISIEHRCVTWQMTAIVPDIEIQDGLSKYRPVIICVINEHPPKVIAFRVGPEQKRDENASLALYDAVSDHRYPALWGSGRLAWALPTVLLSSISSVSLPLVCQRLGITFLQQPLMPKIVEVLSGAWLKDLREQGLTRPHFEEVLDNYLGRFHHYAPRANANAQEYNFRHSMGYEKDPAWMCAPLRLLLPAYTQVVDPNGAIHLNGLNYEHPFLLRWKGQHVTLRISPRAESDAWVYVSDEILCLAQARELRRRDGSYRPNR